MNKFWNFIQNQNEDDEVELRISGDIIDDENVWIHEWLGIQCASANKFRNELKKYKNKDITVWIDSFGGSVFAAAGIYNSLKEHKGKVTTKVDGKAMSAASVIFMAGDERLASPLGIIMIHNPATSAEGDARVMKKAAEVLDIVKETIINAYMRSGKSREEISEMMDDETYMSANVAVKNGFADGILYDDKEPNTVTNLMENSFTFSRLVIQNSMADNMKKFFEVARENQSKDNDSQNSSAYQEAAKLPDANIKNKQEEDISMKVEDIKTTADLKNAFPKLASEIETTAKDEGVKNECARLKAIDEIAFGMDNKLVQNAKYGESPMNAGELAIAARKADISKGKEYLENAEDDIKASGNLNVGADPTTGITDDADKQAKEETIANAMANGMNKRRVK